MYKCRVMIIRIVILLMFRDRLESCFQHFDVMDCLEDNLQLCQVLLSLLHLVRQQRPQPLHVAGADVVGVQLNLLECEYVHHDDTLLTMMLLIGRCCALH